VSSDEWGGPEYEKTSSYNSTTAQWEESETFTDYSSNRGIFRHVSAVTVIFDLHRNVPVLISQGRSNGYFQSSTFDPDRSPPLPVWPGGTGTVEPLAAMGAKALSKVAAAKIAGRQSFNVRSDRCSEAA